MNTIKRNPPRNKAVKVFLVNDTDGEGDVYYAASTYAKARKWIKKRQLESIKHRRKQGWTEKQLEGFKQHYEDPNELHPYDIQAMVIDEE